MSSSEKQPKRNKPSGIFNMAALGDEIVEPPQRFHRASKKRTESRERTKQRTPVAAVSPKAKTTATATATATDNATTTEPLIEASSSTDSHRSATRSLSPKKLRRNFSGSLTPMLTPVMKGLKMLSRNVRSPSPLSPSGTMPGGLPFSSSEAAERSRQQQRSNSAPDANAMAADAALTAVSQDKNDRPTRLADMTKQTRKALAPPSGRFDLPPDDDDDDDEHDDEGAKPFKPLSSSSSIKPSSLSSTGEKKPSSASSSVGGTQPLSWSSTSSKQKPPSFSSSVGSSGEHIKPSSINSSGSHKKPPSSSSAGSSSSSDAPSLPRPASVDRRRVPRNPHKSKSEGITPITPKSEEPSSFRTSKLRARSATPRHRQIEEENAAKNTATEPPPPAATSTRRSSSQSNKSRASSSSGRHRSSSHEPNPEARPDATSTSRASSKSRPVARSQSPSKAAAAETPTSPERRETSQAVPTGKTRENKVSKDDEPGTVIIRERRDSKQRRARSKSRDKKSSNVAITKKNDKSSSPTRVPFEDRETPRRARSKSREQQSNGEPRVSRRGRKPPNISANPNKEEESANPTTASAGGNDEQTSTDNKLSSARSTVRQRRSSQAQQQQQQQPNVVSLDEVIEKPESARAKPADKQRKNLNKETLEHVKDLKDEFQEMRMQRRKVKFGAKEQGSAEAPNRTTPRSKSDGVAVALQQSPHPAKSPGAGKSRHSVPAGSSSLASLNTSQLLHNSGSTLFNSSKSTTFTNRSDLNSSRSTLQSSKTDLSSKDSVLVNEFNSSYISIQDLDVGYMKGPTGPVLSEEELQTEALQKKIKKTKKLIKRTTRDVWAEREEIINLQRKNWSIRKALMQNEGPPDSLTTLNMKIEKLLRQERELDLESDRMREEKEALEAECANTTKTIGEFRDLYDKLNRTIVPLLPVPENTPEEVDATDSWSGPISPLPSPSGTTNRLVFSSAASLPAPLAPDMMEEMDSPTLMADSLHSMEDKIVVGDDQQHQQEEEGSLSLSHIRLAMPSRVSS